MKQYELFIDGKFLPNGDRKMIPVINPSTEEVISEIPAATKEDADCAVLAAEAAQKDWAKKAPIERAKYLREIAALVRENGEMIARTIAEEQGKTMGLSRVEAYFTADYMDYMAEWARRYEGEIVNSDSANENILIYKLPIGVAAGILPWNFPFFLIARKMAPALVTGNTIVIKPSTETPNNAYEFAKLVAKSSLPHGVFNMITGSGAIVGQALASNPKVGIVSMTGSVPAGAAIMAAAAPNITKVSLELGGKAPAIVMADADLDLAARCIRDSRTINSGQVCNCAERVYVQESVADAFIEKIVARMKEARFGNVLEDETLDYGPMINKTQLDSVEQDVEEAVADGAKCILGGHRVDKGKGFWFPPTVLVNCRQDMSIMHKEIFGPVLPIATFKTLDEAIFMANDCEFGLTSSIYTNDMNVVMRACNEIKFGETYVNRHNFEAMQGFHAGFRKSGIGGADGKHGLEEYLQTHVVYIQYDNKKQ